MKSIIPLCALFALAFISCHDPNDISSEWVQSQPISDSELHAKQGDCLSFVDSTGNYFIGTIVSFNKSEGGIWYAICFANYYDTAMPSVKVLDTMKLDTYKVFYYPTSKYNVGYSVTWARDTLVEAHMSSLLGNPNIPEIKKLEIKEEGSVFSYSYFLNFFNYFKTRKLLTQQYNKAPLDSTLHPDTLISFRGLIDAVTNNEKAQSNR